MSEKNNGGPAFPALDELIPTNGSYTQYKAWGNDGMSLRDYFAAQVIARTCDGVNVCDEQGLYERFATHAYRMADAMLRARDA